MKFFSAERLELESIVETGSFKLTDVVAPFVTGAGAGGDSVVACGGGTLALLDGVLNVAFGWAELLFKASSLIPPILLDFAVFCGGAPGFAAVPQAFLALLSPFHIAEGVITDFQSYLSRLQIKSK
jgi:hypothetical protein